MEELGHVQRADFADARDVVAQQIDDHPVLGLVLGIVGQEEPLRAVLLRTGAAWRRPLHRQRLDPAVRANFEEEFRRARQHDGAGQIYHGGMAHRLARGHLRHQRQRVAAPVRATGNVRLP
jgi:hypothetical protein